MRLLYLNCPYGVSEDRLLAALVDAGVSLDDLAAKLAPAARMVFRHEQLTSQGVAGSSISFTADSPPPLSTLEERLEFATKIPLRPWLQNALKETLSRLSASGLVALQSSGEAVIASAVLCVGAIAAALDLLGADALHSSPVGVGQGLAEGSQPGLNPSRIVARLMVGMAIRPVDSIAEISTPAALALVGSAVSAYGPMPPMTLLGTGCGVGTEQWPVPSVVQAFLGEIGHVSEARRVAVLETNIDDMPAQSLEYVMALLFERGALDVYFTPIQMKKNRPAVMVSVLCADEATEACMDVLLRETTTLGVRITHADRRVLEREMVEVETRYGRVQVKAAILEGQVRSVNPEYDACRALAVAHNIPLRAVQEAAVAAAQWELRERGWTFLGDEASGERPKNGGSNVSDLPRRRS